MLEPPRSLWLPLQPLASSSLVGNHHPFNSNFDKRHLPGQSCSIEALRDTLAPLYYSCTQSTSPLDPPAITNATTRDLAAILKLHVSMMRLSSHLGPTYPRAGGVRRCLKLDTDIKLVYNSRHPHFLFDTTLHSSYRFS